MTTLEQRCLTPTAPDVCYQHKPRPLLKVGLRESQWRFWSGSSKSQRPCLSAVASLSSLLPWPVPLYPNWLQTTLAAFPSQRLSHTVAQRPFTHTSTRPSLGNGAPLSRTLPVVLHWVEGSKGCWRREER